METRWAVTLALPARWGRRPLPGLQAQSWLQQEKLVQCHHLKCWQVTSWAEGEICREYRCIYSMNYINQNQWILTSVTKTCTADHAHPLHVTDISVTLEWSLSTLIPTDLCCVLHQGPPNIGALGQTPVRRVGAGRHWVDGLSLGQESRGSSAAGSAWCSL